MKKGGALFHVFNAVFVWEIDRLSRIENRIAFKKESLGQFENRVQVEKNSEIVVA